MLQPMHYSTEGQLADMYERVKAELRDLGYSVVPEPMKKEETSPFESGGPDIHNMLPEGMKLWKFSIIDQKSKERVHNCQTLQEVIGFGKGMRAAKELVKKSKDS